jgi:hypothetical protein
MNITNNNKYNKKCNIIKNIIKSKYKNINFEFIRNKYTDLIEVIIENKSIITLLPNNNWKEIEKHINTKINETYKQHKCNICFNNIKSNVSCNKCSNNWCAECYINLFRSGNGIIKCPYCRFSFGIETPEYMMEICIDEIRTKINN